MMHNDQFTRAERIRLEAFAQVNARNQMRPLELHNHFQEAEKVEQWLRSAKEDA